MLEHGETSIEEALKTLKIMSDMFKKRNWKPRRIGGREFVVDLPNENTLDHVLSRPSWRCKERRLLPCQPMVRRRDTPNPYI